jgi:hypothetical protein
MPNDVASTKDTLAAWLERRGFTPVTFIQWEEGYFTSECRYEDYLDNAHTRLGRIWYRAPGGGAERGHPYLRRVADLLTTLGVWWTAKQNDYGYWYLVVKVCQELDAELPSPEPAAEQEVQPTA